MFKRILKIECTLLNVFNLISVYNMGLFLDVSIEHKLRRIIKCIVIVVVADTTRRYLQQAIRISLKKQPQKILNYTRSLTSKTISICMFKISFFKIRFVA